MASLSAAAADKSWIEESNREVAESKRDHGIPLVINRSHDSVYVLQLGLIANSCEDMDTNGTELGPKVYGIQLAGISNTADDARGIQLALACNRGRVGGVQLSAFNIATECHGIQLGLLANNANEMHGLEFALFNDAKELHGLQLGFYNHAACGAGVQIGVINNFAGSVLPLVNCRF